LEMLPYIPALLLPEAPLLPPPPSSSHHVSSLYWGSKGFDTDTGNA
jgi:hypothetical protein